MHPNEDISTTHLRKFLQKKITSSDFLYTVFIFVLGMLSSGLDFKQLLVIVESLYGSGPLVIGIIKYNWCLLQVQCNCRMY